VAVAARHGILIRSSAFLEELADLTSLVVDKTGTLTYGTLRLQAITARWRISLGLNWPPASGRPAATRSVGRWPGWSAGSLLPLTDIHERQGLGVVAMTEQGEAALGRPELFAQLGIATTTVPDHDGPIAGLALNGEFPPGCCWPTASNRKPALP
jgi:cation transport ATPase